MSGYTGRMNERFAVLNVLSWDGRNPVLTATPTVTLRGILGKPKRVASGVDSPRQFPKYTLEFAKRTVGIDTVVPTEGSRVQGPDGVVYEILGKPRDLTSNRNTYGYAVPMLPVTTLYPNLGTLGGVGGGLGAGINFSMFTNSQAARDRGEYDELEGEAPASTWAQLRVTNASLTLEGDVYRITSAILNREQPHVALKLRRRDS